MSKTHQTCLECGARLADDAEQCDLCGEPIPRVGADNATLPTPPERATEPPELDPPPEVEEAAASAAAVDRPAGPKGIYCNQCGWQNPVGAQFCSMCGARLQAVDAALIPVKPSLVEAPSSASSLAPRAPVATSEPEEAPAVAERAGQAKADHQAVSRQVGIIVGAGVLLVVALFLVTAVSKTQPVASPAEAAQPASAEAVEPGALPPLAAPIVAQVEALEAEIASLSDAAQIAKHRELVTLLFEAGRLDRAALEQQKIAQTTDTSDDWRRAGDLFYDWMDPLQGPEKVRVAGQAIDAYQRVLAVDPDNLDVRTDMATAFLSSNNPMQGVTEIKRVLDVDPDHLHARFNYGIMLAMIGRSELAVEQFDQVKGLVDETSSYYQQADDAIRAIQAGGSL